MDKNSDFRKENAMETFGTEYLASVETPLYGSGGWKPGCGCPPPPHIKY